MAGNDMFGQMAKAYMIADMLTPPRQPQVIETGYSQEEMNAVTRLANSRIRQANAMIEKLVAGITQLRDANRKFMKGTGKTSSDYVSMLEGQQTEAFRVISELRTQIARLEVENDDLKAGRIPA
ncbi:putative phage infection (PIP) family protein YhgE [Neorhizobium galegae]|uniref:hypothetical protein n=1 Tax=Neorhizobium galegae TaxID=399 RepID=UPI001AE49935|nr:hypothetical protein [Neorhizobium galegae]MBP2563327.1 putative phage infection (PIP) family protein YhgE [Neorhizobium galegae]